VTAVVAEATGAVAERYVYAAYGERTVLDGGWQPVQGNESPVANQRAFQGQEREQQTGLHASRVRPVYHPTLGVFPSRDDS